MVHVRETRALASEVKFLISPALAPRILDWARTHLVADPHGEGAFGDEYDTTTLYFDTPALDVFARRASYGRAKYRVRRYGAAPQIFLERKLRKPGMLIKRRTIVPCAAIHHLSGREADPHFAGHWFLRRLEVRALQPICQVAYHRVARVLPSSGGTARMTLDSRLRALPVSEARFRHEPGVPFMEDRLVLELKYRSHAPALFKRLVEEFALCPATSSKYRLGMEALGYGAAAEERDRPVGTDASYV